MKNIGKQLVFGCMALGAVHAQTSPQPQVTNISRPADPDAIRLDSMKETTNTPEIWANFYGSRIVRNVTEPTLTPVLPDPAKATGAAVIVAPGGAFLMLSIDSEGYAVARWLADHGIAAFVLKYRLTPSAEDPREFMAQLGAIVRSASGKEAGEGLKTPQPALGDAIAAVKLVRARATEWKIDPTRVGFVGFSAGAMTAISIALAPNAAERPNFVAPIYPPMNERPVATDAPPAFIAIAADDQLFGGGKIGLFQSWIAAKRPAELHIYTHGGHGFGMAKKGSSSDHWIDEFYWWIDAMGFLKTKG